MDDFLRVNVLETLHETGNKETGCAFVESANSAKMESEIALRKKIQDEVQIVSVLKRVMHVGDQRVFKL